jgi:hypothetical protein
MTTKHRTTASKTKKQQQHHAVTTITTTTPTTRKQPNQALSPTPIKPRSTQKTAEKAQQCPHKNSRQNPKRNPHKIGKLTVNRKTNKTTTGENKQ